MSSLVEKPRLQRRGADPGDLVLDHHPIAVVLLVRSAELFGYGLAQEAQLSRDPPGLAVDQTVFVPLLELGNHVFVDKFAYRRAKPFVVRVEQVAVRHGLRTASSNLAVID